MSPARQATKPGARASRCTGIEIKGWHTLRHSYTTLLRQNNNNPKVVQGLLRHASYSSTMNVYHEAMSEEKRNAHRGVIQQLNRSVTRSAPKPAIPQVVDKVWRPRRDLNPCYRRESRPRVRNRLKLNGTDSPLGHLSDCGDGLSDC